MTNEKTEIGYGETGMANKRHGSALCPTKPPSMLCTLKNHSQDTLHLAVPQPLYFLRSVNTSKQQLKGGNNTLKTHFSK